MAYINGKEVLFAGRLGGTIAPTATYPISKNGKYDVTDFASVEVNVEAKAPEGYIKPSETTYITANGDYDVTASKTAKVQVPKAEVFEPPLENIDITTNGIHDVSKFKKATVNVAGSAIPEGYLKPSGTYDIIDLSKNGTRIYVGNFEYIYLNIPTFSGDAEFE